jgi:hypothetical protein
MWIAVRAGNAAAAVLVALVTPTLSCAMSIAPSTLPPADVVVKAGQWGGQHIEMTVADNQTTIEFDCGRAAVSGRMTVDRSGGFDVAGQYFPEAPGPTRRDEPPPRPLRLSGTVRADSMQVQVVLTDTKDVIGEFSLGFGAAARLIKCR